MTVKTSENTASSQPLQNIFSELQDAQTEFEGLFGGVFDQLQTLSLELFARHQRLQLSALQHAESEAVGAAKQRDLDAFLDEMRHLQEKYLSAQEETQHAWTEVSATQLQLLKECSLLHEAQDQARGAIAEILALREGIEQNQASSNRKFDALEEHIQQMATAMTAQPPSTTQNEQLDSLIETNRQQEAAWQRERATLEAEIAAHRQRADQQRDALEDQRRLSAQQQAKLAVELKRMCALLEVLSKNMTQPNEGNAEHPSSSDNPVLESMLAQFDMLQRDIAQRRSGGQKETLVT